MPTQFGSTHRNAVAEAIDECGIYAKVGETLSISSSTARVPFYLLRAVARLLGRAVVYRKLRYAHPEDKKCGAVLIAAFTSNQIKALTWAKDLEGAMQIGIQADSELKFPYGRLAIKALMSIPGVCLELRRRGILSRCAFAISEMAMYVPAKSFFLQMAADVQLSAVVMANDHTAINRALLAAAKSHGIATVYTQHGTVSPIFPALEFDLALLDGLYSADIYAELGGASNVYITGRNRPERIERAKRTSIALAPSSIDSIDIWRDVVRELSGVGVAVVLRPHPADRRDARWRKMCCAEGAQFVAAGEMALSDLLGQSAMLIAGQSGVLLDACIQGVEPLLLSDTILNESYRDYYGYVRTGVATSVTIAQLRDTVSEKLKSPADAATLHAKAAYYDFGLQADPSMLKRQVVTAWLDGKAPESKFVLRRRAGDIAIYYPAISHAAA